MNKLYCLLLVLFTLNTLHGQTPVTTFPFTEGFENINFRNSWNTYDRGSYKPGENTDWIIRTYLVHSGTGSIVYTDGGPIQDGWLVTPQIILPAGSVYTLSFWSAIRYPTDYDAAHNAKISVQVSTQSGNPDDGKFVEIWSPASVPQDWLYAETVLDLTAYAEQSVYIAFRYQGDGYAWCLDDVSLTRVADNDVGVTAITSPISGKNLSSQQSVTVTVNNFSSHTQNLVPVRLEIDNQLITTETIATIAAQSHVNFTFTTKVDLSAVKKYTIEAYTTLSEDENTANNATTAAVRNYGTGIISTFPYTESFENDDDLFLWSQKKGVGNLSWKYQKGDESGLIQTPRSGDRNAFFYSSLTKGSTKLITPPLDLTTLESPVVKFWYVQEDFYGGLDTLTVYVKNSSAGNWTPIFKGTKANTEWADQTLELPNPSAEYYIAFEGTAAIGDGILLDDITVSNPVDKDVALLSIEGPVSNTNMTALEPVVVRLKNMGRQTLSAIPVSYKIGTTVVNETITGPFKTFADTTYTFNTKADLSAVKTYIIEVYTTLSGDEVSKNDRLTTTVTNYGDVAIIGKEPSFTTCNIRFTDDGVNENYLGDFNQTQTVTFYPAEAGKRVQAAFTMFSISPYQIVMGAEFPGDSLVVYDGNTVDENNRIAVFTGELSGNFLPTIASHAPDGSLTFVFKKINGFDDAGWEATISCITPTPFDAGVKQILLPLKGGNAAAPVKVLLKNYGGSPITSMKVGYNQVAETFTGNILPGETVEYTFNQKIDVSAIKEDHTIEAYTQLTSDGDASNDRVSITFPYRENVTLYGYRISDDNFQFPNALGVVSFGSNDPETVTLIHPYKDGGNVIAVGESDGEYFYVYSGFMSNTLPANFIKLTKDWVNVDSKSVSEKVATLPLDMAYDRTSNTMFALSFRSGVDDYQKMNEVDLTTGELIPVGNLTHFFEAIACSQEGQLYGISNYGVFCSINKQTGQVTEISNTGMRPTNQFQSMTFDQASGRLFWAMTNDRSGKLYELNPVTGAITDCGKIGGNAEIVALHTPSSFTKIEIPELNAGESFTIYPNPSEGFVTLSEVPEQSIIRIVDLSGKTLQTYWGLSGKVALDLKLKSGIYFVRIDAKDNKMTRKLIIK